MVSAQIVRRGFRRLRFHAHGFRPLQPEVSVGTVAALPVRLLGNVLSVSRAIVRSRDAIQDRPSCDDDPRPSARRCLRIGSLAEPGTNRGLDPSTPRLRPRRSMRQNRPHCRSGRSGRARSARPIRHRQAAKQRLAYCRVIRPRLRWQLPKPCSYAAFVGSMR